MPGNYRRRCAYTLRASAPEGAVFDRGLEWVGLLFALAVASFVGAGFVLAILRTQGSVRYVLAVGPLFLGFMAFQFISRLVTPFELRTDRAKGRIFFRNRRWWTDWVERWSVEGPQVKAVRLGRTAVSLDLMNGRSFVVDAGEDPGRLRILAEHLSQALGKPVSGPDA